MDLLALSFKARLSVSRVLPGRLSLEFERHLRVRGIDQGRQDMRIHHSELGLRLFASAIAIGFLCIGAYAVFGGDETVTALERERANGFGWCAILAGLFALGLTWLVEDLSNIWCRPPRRWR